MGFLILVLIGMVRGRGISDCGLWITGCGFGISDCGLGIDERRKAQGTRHTAYGDMGHLALPSLGHYATLSLDTE